DRSPAAGCRATVPRRAHQRRRARLRVLRLPRSGVMAGDLAFTPIPELGRRLRARRVSATELSELSLERLERFGPRYNCLVTVTPERALAEAARADRELAAGRLRGPLHGIPYGVKDLLAVRGYPTTWGAEPYRAQTFEEDRSEEHTSELQSLAYLVCRL